ncbi:HAD family hydrolase [Vibrio atypicus]|uniref:HAD family hydrolase n=1 Tax=Vibrio atypicus TaxID=558271 RepID=UPI001357CE01|nr:HAD family hydrolase [Vibrio atypicus]
MKSIILIDFDGVIRQWPGNEVNQAEALLGITQGALYSCAFSNELLSLAVCGEITHQQWCDKVTEQLARSWNRDAAVQLVKTWNQARWDIDWALLEGIRNHSPDGKIVLVTNGTSRLEEDLTVSKLDGHFDLVVSSSHIGVAKPDRLFFEIALQLAGGCPHNAIFIDDSATNVSAAKAMGIDSITHINRDETLAFVRDNY